MSILCCWIFNGFAFGFHKCRETYVFLLLTELPEKKVSIPKFCKNLVLFNTFLHSVSMFLKSSTVSANGKKHTQKKQKKRVWKDLVVILCTDIQWQSKIKMTRWRSHHIWEAYQPNKCYEKLAQNMNKYFNPKH